MVYHYHRLELGGLLTTWHSHHGERAPSTYVTGQWNGPRAKLDTMAKRKSPPLPEMEPRVCLSSHVTSHYADKFAHTLIEYTVWVPVILVPCNEMCWCKLVFV